MNVDPNEPRKARLTRADSRALDGALSSDDAARTAREQAADPSRARAVADHRRAMDLWVEEARRTAEALDAPRLAQRVLAAAAPTPASTQAPWGYAAAAVALLGVGVVGALSAGPSATAPSTPAVALELEQGHLAVLRSVEIDTIPLSGEGR